MDHPTRGGDSDYARYLAGMDASMRQKVALTAAHLLARGTVADMGMGSGAGSQALAALYPELSVIGVDVDPKMVELAREKYTLPNLRFQVGDIAAPIFEPGTLDAIFDSSVLHHVTSFGGYDRDAAERAMAVQVGELSDHGVLIVRDFVDPGDEMVLLDLPADDGDDDGADPARASTAALFERFAGEFRSLAETRGFAFERVTPAEGDPPLAAGRRRYRLSHTHAAEFVLRKDYRRDWVSEVKEEYTYLTERGFEAVLRRLGLRVLASTPIRNPWIVQHRFAGKFSLWSESGATLDYPATNTIVVGEKVPTGLGVRFERGNAVLPLNYLTLECYEQRDSGRVRDLVHRPHPTLDVLPWFIEGDAVHVLARMSYPRPLLCANAPGIDGSLAPHYVTEPLTLIQGDKPAAQTAEEFLEQGLGLSADAIEAIELGDRHYPSPGGVREVVESLLVRIGAVTVAPRVAGRSGFSSSGRVGAVEATQLLRCAQVGGLPDARLELAVYDLLARLGRDPGPWLGDTPKVTHELDVPVTMAGELLARPARRAFRRVPVERSPAFLSLAAHPYREHDAEGRVVAERVLESVVPSALSTTSVAIALLARVGNEVVIGVDDDDLPAAQCFTGSSALLVAPAWRLPRDVTSLTAMQTWVSARLSEQYGVQGARLIELGGRYHPSPGVTPEVVHPLALEVTSIAAGRAPLSWVPLAALIAARSALLKDAHLRIVALRAGHALGR